MDHKENGGDKSKDDNPKRESSKIRISTDVNFFDDSDLMHVEENSEDIADDKRYDDDHKNNRKVVVLLPPVNLPPLADDHIDLVVQVANYYEREDTKNHQPCPVVVPGNIWGGHPQICNFHVNFFVFINHLALQKFWDVEKH